ncbi:LOW QUALITY PROTEIN: hypothetical protein HID58_014751 [Brassica napus]|uniref:Uncharacterized protein n=1 Tax=Brassica napus TaxID=3708 RepID=A0ABQ8DI06_BRANA|nr:LOW QUALITY PROTEIN: hypothetical protein HID58_014751 [Brassica napus]
MFLEIGEFLFIESSLLSRNSHFLSLIAYCVYVVQRNIERDKTLLNS